MTESWVKSSQRKKDARFPDSAPRLDIQKYDTIKVISDVTPDILSVISVDANKMSAYELAVYNQHLVENKQDATSYQIAFWTKIIYPFSVFVMMALALPFAYLHFRSGGVSLKIFTGIMIGVAFILINNLFFSCRVAQYMAAIFDSCHPKSVVPDTGCFRTLVGGTTLIFLSPFTWMAWSLV